MPEIVRPYSDIDLDFNPHPVTGDINLLKGVDAVKRSIRNLILTAPYERPFQPGLGSGITQLLFEPVNPMTQHAIEMAVKDVLRAHEKRATIVEVIANVNPDENGYNVTIVFAVDNLSQIAEIDVFLERVR